MDDRAYTFFLWVIIVSCLSIIAVSLGGCAEATVVCPRGVTGPCTVRSKSFLRRIVVDVNHDRICVDHQSVSGNAAMGGVMLGAVTGNPAAMAVGGVVGLAADVFSDKQPSACKPTLVER